MMHVPDNRTLAPFYTTTLDYGGLAYRNYYSLYSHKCITGRDLLSDDDVFNGITYAVSWDVELLTRDVVIAATDSLIKERFV